MSSDMKYIKSVLLVALFSGIAFNTWAENAPVYDVDSYSQYDEPSRPSNAVATGAASSADTGYVAEQAYTSSSPTASMGVAQRLSRLEQQINNMQRSDLSSKVDDTQAQLQALRGQIEELTHQLQKLQTQQKTMYADLDKRLTVKKSPAIASTTSNKPTDTVTSEDTDTPDEDEAVTSDDMSANNAAKTVASSTTTTATKTSSKTTGKMQSAATSDSQPNVAEEQQLYQNAYNLIKSKKYNEAAASMQKMLQKYPSGQFAANAHYWLGELYGLMGKNDQAITEFSSVVKNYPDSPKLADSQLKLGLIYAASFKWSEAKAAFKKVINTYPGTSTAHLANEQLNQIKQAGH